MPAVNKWRNAGERLKDQMARLVKAASGQDTSLDKDDRRVLEDVIFPYFVAREDFARVLFVGCDWYTKHYNKVFREKEYWTIDRDPTRSKYGADRHVTDALEHLTRHFAPGFFDLIVCNGVFGWGLDGREEAEAAFDGSFRCLRDGGVLVLGWNDIPEKRPFSLEECRSLGRFRPLVLPPLGTSRFLTRNPNRHTFDFYVKAASSA